MEVVVLPEIALTERLSERPRMTFGIARRRAEGLVVVDHRHLGKRELDDHEVRADLLRWAADSGLSLIEWHTHIDGDPACMSLIDVAGLIEWAPHVRWRTGGRPYAALVLAETTVDGVVWAGDDPLPQPDPVEAVVFGSARFATTRRSITRFETPGGVDDGN